MKNLKSKLTSEHKLYFKQKAKIIVSQKSVFESLHKLYFLKPINMVGDTIILCLFFYSVLITLQMLFI